MKIVKDKTPFNNAAIALDGCDNWLFDTIIGSLSDFTNYDKVNYETVPFENDNVGKDYVLLRGNFVTKHVYRAIY